MQNSTAVSSAGPGRAVSHADASDPAPLRKRARSARAADRTCEEAPFASASSVAKRARRRRGVQLGFPHGTMADALPSPGQD